MKILRLLVILISFSYLALLLPFSREEVEFSISHPSTPERFIQYEIELEYVFSKVTECLLELRRLRKSIQEGGGTVDGVGNENAALKTKSDEVLMLALELFYYWVNFGPITRGTSATGGVNEL